MEEEEDKIEGIDVQIEMEDVLIDPPVVPPEDGIAELKRQLDEERARRVDLERRNHELAQREHAARIDKEDTDLQLVANAIETLDQDSEVLKAGYAQAMQAGDYRRAAEIQEELSANSAKLLQLRNGYEAMKAKPKAAPPQQVPSDPVEAFASQLSARSAAWVRAHPEFVRDPAKTRKMIAAHELAVADGIAPDSDAYFEAIEATLRVRPQAQVQAQEEDAMAGAAKVTQRRDAAPAAAPVSRGQPSRNTVRLTAAEREMAEMMNMKPEEYARNKLALQKEGKLQ
jgi:hypothetical protein